MLKQLLAEYPGDVRIVFKHFPLSFHQNAKPAALAAIAAAKQQKFWEMHDLLFKNQQSLDAASLRRYAETLGLDLAAYDKVVADPESSRMVDREVLEGQSAGVRGTPTVFVNGVQAPAWDLNTVKRLIEAAKSGGDVGRTAGQIRADMNRQRPANQPPPIDYNKIHEIDVAGAPFKGPAGAPVVIVAFSDYQWPYCAGAEPLFKQVLDAYPTQVRLVHKHYPLSFHPNARPAAEAAEFAKKSGKFWEMHELLFKNYSALTHENLKGFARQLGLDEKGFAEALVSHSMKAGIDRDVADAQKAQVTGTPTIFVNGRRLQRRDFPSLKAMIDQALAAPSPAAK